MNESKEHELIYPVPLFSRSLPAAVKVDGFLPPEHCRELVELSLRKGLEAIVRSRHGQETFVAQGCWITPEDDERVFERVARKSAEVNAQHWRIALSGIYSPFSILKYVTGGWIRPHTDSDYRLADATKLSCIIQLVSRDAFSGGRLTIGETEAYDLDIGDAVFFPAQTIHAVSDIESGERYVLAAWVQGPDFA